MALTNNLEIKIRSTLTSTVGLSSVTSTVNTLQSTDLTTVATDAIYTETVTMAGGTVDIDLDGSLTDPLGDAVTFGTVMAVYIINNGANAMTVGGVNNIPMINAGGTMNVAAGAYVMYTDPTGITVTAGTADLITVSGTNGDTFDIVVIGAA